MSKRGRPTTTGRAHSNPNDPLHGIHKTQQQARKARHAQGRFVFVEGRQEGDLYPVFESVLSDLGVGYCWQVQRDEKGKITGVNLMDGETWEKELAEQTARLSWYHQFQSRRDAKGSWRKRKIKDRSRLTPRDRRERPDSDVERATYELRPDHSRAIQYLIKANRKDDVRRLLARATAKKCQIFEKIYVGRKVTYGAEHSDSGQHHDDLWHTGIREVPDVAIRKTQVRRERTPHREFGVGPGISAWRRHEVVLESYCARRSRDYRNVMGDTVIAIEQSVEHAYKQNETFPRDIQFNEELDFWMDEELKILDERIVNLATSEYAEHLLQGYEQGLLGRIRKETGREKQLQDRIAHLETQIGEIENALPEQPEGEIKKSLPERVTAVVEEAQKLPGIREAVQGIVSAMLKGLPAIQKAVEKLAQLVGLPLPNVSERRQDDPNI